MKNIKNFKCPQCGATRFNQLSSSMFECEYCGTKVVSNEAVKDKFINDMNTSSNIKNNVGFIKAKITEEEFYKKALIHLGMNKYSPSDILDSDFGHVKHSYKYFVVLDVDFTALIVNNSSSFSDDSLNISTQEKVNYKLGKYVCIKISNDVTHNQLQYITNNLENSLENIEFKPLTLEEANKMDLPKREIIEQHIDDAINHLKSELFKSETNEKSNQIVHFINKIDLYAFPEYSMEYTYNGKKYEICSFAHALKIEGELPKRSNELKIQQSKKILPITICSFIASLAAIIFALIHLQNKQMGLIKYEIGFIVVVLILFVLNIVVNKIVVKTTSKKLFETKKQKLQEHFNNTAIKLTDKDIKYIDNIMRWC